MRLPLLVLLLPLVACAATVDTSGTPGDGGESADTVSTADAEVDADSTDTNTPAPDADENPDTDAPVDAADASTEDDTSTDAEVDDTDAADIQPPDDTSDDTSIDAADTEFTDAPELDTLVPDPDVELDIADITETPDATADTIIVADAGADTLDTPDTPDTPDVDPVVCVDTSTLPIPAPTERTYMAGRWETVSTGGFRDEYLVDADDYIQVGIRPEWGGSLVFFGLRNGAPGPNNSNTIDANDTGREVQVALYDPDRLMQGCAWNASCRTGGAPCANSIRYLGWNPVQGGSRCNRGPGLEDLRFERNALIATVVPLQWNPDWNESTCGGDLCADPARRDARSDVRIVQSLRFVRQHVLELSYTIYHLSPVSRAATEHELPTLYSANGNAGPDLWRLMTADGRQIDINEPANDGFFYRNLDSAAPWVTLQNDLLTYGVGLYMENGLTSFQGWQNRGLPFNNVRARFPFPIPALGVVQARAYLMLGSFATQQAEADRLTETLPPFGAVDTPTDGLTLSPDGTLTVAGWALDNTDGLTINVIVDGERTVAALWGDARPDVCQAWPGYPGCPNPGFRVVVPASVIGEPRCAHTLDVVATDRHGNRFHLGRRLVTPATAP
jgi:hypothetical protein